MFCYTLTLKAWPSETAWPNTKEHKNKKNIALFDLEYFTNYIRQVHRLDS